MLKIRCSSLSDIMTEPRSKADQLEGKLSQTAISKLIEMYTQEEYGREKDIQTKYTKKGLNVEEDSITLISRIKKTFFKKNAIRIENDYLSGEPDTYVGKDIYHAERIFDVKSSWDLFTFNKAKYDHIIKGEINPSYYAQMQGYMDLTGAKSASLCYCLIDTPQALIFDEQNRLKWKMGVINPDTDETYLEACEELERNMTFNDIPLHDKLYEIEIPRDDEYIAKVHEKILKCQKFYEETFKKPSLLIAEYDTEINSIIISK